MLLNYIFSKEIPETIIITTENKLAYAKHPRFSINIICLFREKLHRMLEMRVAVVHFSGCLANTDMLGERGGKPSHGRLWRAS